MKARLEALVREGVESPYLERLRVRVNPAQAVADIEREIHQEIASSLGRSEENLERALLDVDVVLHRMRGATGDDLARFERDYEAARQVALRRRWELEVHREAVGFRNHAALDRLHPMPPRRPSAS